MGELAIYQATTTTEGKKGPQREGWRGVREPQERSGPQPRVPIARQDREDQGCEAKGGPSPT